MGRQYSNQKDKGICRKCGRRVHWAYIDERFNYKNGYLLPVDPETLVAHHCEPTNLKIYTAEEREEFARKRAEGKI